MICSELVSCINQFLTDNDFEKVRLVEENDSMSFSYEPPYYSIAASDRYFYLGPKYLHPPDEPEFNYEILEWESWDNYTSGWPSKCGVTEVNFHDPNSFNLLRKILNGELRSFKQATGYIGRARRRRFSS